MKTMNLKVLGLVMVLSAAPGVVSKAWAAGGASSSDDMIFQATVGGQVATASQETPAQAIALGTVTLSAQGEVKVVWDGVTANLGSLTVGQAAGAGPSRTFVSAKLPTLYLDLQKLFGVNWMKAIRLSVAGGSYDDNPIAGKTDINLGQISLNLTQTVVKTRSLQWTWDESASVTSYFRRVMYESSTPFEAVPVNFAVNTTVVANISSEAVVSISMGAFAAVYSGINQNAGFEGVAAGGHVTPSVTFGSHWAVGANLDGCELFRVAGATGSATAINASGFVKYMFSSDHGRVRHAIELSVGTMDDGIVTNASGQNTRSTWGGLKYSIAF